MIEPRSKMNYKADAGALNSMWSGAIRRHLPAGFLVNPLRDHQDSRVGDRPLSRNRVELGAALLPSANGLRCWLLVLVAPASVRRVFQNHP